MYKIVCFSFKQIYVKRSAIVAWPIKAVTAPSDSLKKRSKKWMNLSNRDEDDN
jgi:hypothetical protein